MKKLYYKVWVDCILRIKNFDSYAWQFKSMTIMTFAMAIATMLISAIIQSIMGVHFYKLGFSNPIGRFTEGFILFFLPFIILNYLLIFHKKKYQQLINQYPYNGGKYVMAFFFGTMATVLLAFVTLIFLGKVK